MGIDRGRVEASMSRKTLGQADIFRGPVEVGAGGVAKAMEGKISLEASALLPASETVADLSV